MTQTVNPISDYKYGFHKPENYAFKAEKGLSEKTIEKISWHKNEPFWMTKFRLDSLKIFYAKQMPLWGGDLSKIDFDDIYYYIKPIQNKAKSWEDLPKDIKDTYDRIGIPEAEKKFLGGVSAQYESEVVYKSIQKTLGMKGVIFLDMDSGLREYPDLVREYFGKLISPSDNKFAALNSAAWSGGSFIYVPKGVHVELPLQAYFRINAANMGQFERTLIIADEGSFVHYVEGCFTKGTKISTNPDYKPIEKIKTGDKVLTHLGKYRKVYHTQVRPYTGNLYTIDYRGETTQKLEVTGEHPFLTVERERLHERNINFKPIWKKASELATKDYLAVPVNKIINSHRSHIFKVKKGAGRHKPKIIKRKVILSNDFFRLVGYYLAEGSISSGYYLNFSFGDNERKLIDDVKRLIKKVFAVDHIHESVHKKNNGISVVVNSVELARIFSQFGTSSDTKRIPQWIMLENPFRQKEIIVGLFRGDGNYYKRKNKYGLKEIFRINTTSEMLARQMRDILLRLKIVSYINKRERLNEGRKTMYTVGISGEFMIGFSKLVEIEVCVTINNHKRATLFAIDDNYAYLPIRNIKKEFVKNIQVYNFSVNYDESYVASGVAVHNCTAPVYTTDSLHSAVVEIYVKKGARVRYTTIQNWSTNVYNLVTKRMRIEEEGIGEWVDGNIGSKLTMKYPSVYLMGKGARGEVLSIAYAGANQHQDAGGKAIHFAPYTSSKITSKSISARGGRTSYRGLIQIFPHATKSKTKVVCDALLIDDASRSDTYPTMDIRHSDVQVEHEATVSKIGDEQLFYLSSRGLKKADAEAMIVNGFIEPIVKELPLEYAVELNRLIQLEMQGSVG